jgi:hypothetical protein
LLLWLCHGELVIPVMVGSTVKVRFRGLHVKNGNAEDSSNFYGYNPQPH